MRSSRPPASVSGATQSSLIGRRDILSRLLVGLARNSRGDRIGIGGAAGIGKSRILDEFFRRARAQGAQVAHEHCSRADFLRPLSLVANLARTLTRLRGALGANPDSVAVLQRFLANAKARLAALTDAEHRGAAIAPLSDVVAAISEAGPIVIAIDDAQVLPPLVSRLVSARLDRLSPSAYGVLETVAVLGPDADLRAMEWVSLLDRASILAATRELETTGITYFSESTISARALWTEAVVQRASTSTQRLLHRYAAEWLQHVMATRGAYDHRRHLAIATHSLEAGDPVRAQPSLSGGAETLAASGFVNEAAAMTERAAEIAGPLDWRTSALGRLDRHVVRT